MEDEKYEDILCHPYQKSDKHVPMSMLQRAAQFSPFAALTGYEEAISETGRYTEEREELFEDGLNELDEQLHQLMERIGEEPEAEFLCFEKDRQKNGGSYKTVLGRVCRIDTEKRRFVLTDGREIPMDDICRITME